MAFKHIDYTVGGAGADSAPAAENFEATCEIMELESGFATAIDSLDTEIAAFEAYDADMDSLELLSDIIEEHGICKPLMAYADPEGDLQGHVKGLVATESLDVNPITDDNAVMAVEGFKETMKSWWENIKKFFKMIWEKLKDAFAWIVSLFTRYETQIKKAGEKLKGANLDDKKAKDKKVTAFSMDTFKKLSGCLEPIGKALGAMSGPKDIDKVVAAAKAQASFLGISVEVKDDAPQFVAGNPPQETENTVSSHGYKIDDMLKELGVAASICVVLRALPNAGKAVKQLQASAEKALKSAEKLGAESEIKALREEVKVIQKQTAFIPKIAGYCAKLAKTYMVSAIKAANATAACTK